MESSQPSTSSLYPSRPGLGSVAHDPTDHDDSDISTIPFVDQPAFGKGLWRKPIKFVAAASQTAPTADVPAAKALSIAEQYLAIVFPNGQPKVEAEYPICPTCNAPIKEADNRAHYLTIGHQLSLPTAPTPSAIDRTRMSLKYMEKHGFDIDARQGLGASSSGILYPILPKEKADKHGIGIQIPKNGVVAEKEKEKRLDAGQVRKKVAEEKKKAEKLRRMFYEDDKVSRYLGELDERSASGNGLDLGAFKTSKQKGKRRR